ncbi:uncharacterized protein LOC127842158 [Dreissena polymorpha]|uniref:uncharacterized protein LOC127842158 n=1 Tax=Dreissena polymorpha TaxID=45954 RepID=UPI002263BB10|nr:uncharacterized protein LOC127842158 [Dreissena polymorpha]
MATEAGEVSGPTDIGRCNLVKHHITLDNDRPFKQPYRRIPPGMFEEVRQHVKEMQQCGAIHTFESHLERLTSGFQRLEAHGLKLKGAKCEFFNNSGTFFQNKQQEDSSERVIAYASQGLRRSERNYPANKLEFLALKWAIANKFHDYLYATTFTVTTDNNPLTYVMSTAKLDATGQRWVAALSMYNFDITYKAGKLNSDCDGLSRRPQLFSDAIKAICESVPFQQPAVEFLAGVSASQMVTVDAIPSACTVNQIDWSKEQSCGRDISQVIDMVHSGTKPKAFKDLPVSVEKLIRNFDRLSLFDEVLYRNSILDGEQVRQLVVPYSYRLIACRGVHDDVGHPGRVKSLWLARQRFYWPGMEQCIDSHVSNCRSCICSKTPIVPSANLIPMETSRQMQLVCIDFLKVDQRKCGYEDVLVITDHFTRYAKAIPCRNQKATTTAKVLFEHFIAHYSFPEQLHSDQGRNFESQVFKELCNLANVRKTRTTPFIPWAYNATKSSSTGYSPHFLMFGWHPRLPVDAYLGTTPGNDGEACHSAYILKLQERLKFAYRVAGEYAKKRAAQNKALYDSKVKENQICINDLVLVRQVNLQGRHKLADKWEREPYIVLDISYEGQPVYRVQRENRRGPIRTLHRNMLLPFVSIPEPEQESQTVRKVKTCSKPSQNSGSDSDSSSNSDSSVQLYIIPQRRNPNTCIAVTPGPVTSISNPVNYHSSQSHSPDSISQPSLVRPSNQSVTGSHSTPVEIPVGSPLSHESSSSSSSLTQSIHENFPPSRPERQRSPPDLFGEWKFAQTAEYFV